MRRRDFIALIGGGTVAWPLAARAQQPDQMRRIGVLISTASDDPVGQARVATFLQGLQQLGWTDGRNMRIDTRWASNNADNGRKYAAELIAVAPGHPCRWQPGDIIVAAGNARRANRVRSRSRPSRRRLCR